MKLRVDYIKKTVNGKTYSYPFLVSSYRDEKGCPTKKIIQSLSHLPEEAVIAMKEALKSNKEVNFVPESSVAFEKSTSFGSEYVVFELLNQMGIVSALSGLNSNNNTAILASIIDRIINPKPYSKKVLSKKFYKSISKRILNINDAIPDQAWYESLEELYENQDKIERILFTESIDNIYLYDITSSYFEGLCCELAKSGYNRDGKEGKVQIVIGLMTNRFGKPISVEVFEGNTADQTTVIDQIKKLKNKFGIKHLTFVGDRGMITRKRIEDIENDEDLKSSVKYITALAHAEIIKFAEDFKNPIQLGLFDEREIVEVEDEGIRYVLCKNPTKAIEDKNFRDKYIEKTNESLYKVFEAISRKKLKNKEKIGTRIKNIFTKWHMEKYFNYEYDEGFFDYKINEEAINKASLLDGCYVLTSNLAVKDASKDELRERYRDLQKVEQAFKTLKTTDIFIRPIRHWNSERVKGHVFLCTLAYMVIWEVRQRLSDFSSKEGSDSDCETIRDVWETLSEISIGTVKIGNKSIEQLSKITSEQKTLLKKLRVSITNKTIEKNIIK